MRRSTINYGVDGLSLAAFCGMIYTGIIIRFILPPGRGAGGGTGRHLSLWGMSRHDWGDLHYWLAIATVLLLLIHVVLHWGWVCETTRRLVVRGEPGPASSPARHTLWGLGFLGVLTGVFALAIWWSATQVIAGGQGGGQGPGPRDGVGRRIDDEHERGGRGPGRGWRGGRGQDPWLSPPAGGHDEPGPGSTPVE